MQQSDPEAPQQVAPAAAGGPARLMSKQMAIYYTNCAMVATSPRDISLYFGRYVPTTDDQGGQRLAELYERQIYMTIEQAQDLARILDQTIQTLKNRTERPT